MSTVPVRPPLSEKSIQQTVDEQIQAAKLEAARNQVFMARAMVDQYLVTAAQHLQRIIEINDEIDALNVRANSDASLERPALDTINTNLEPRFSEVRQFAGRAREALEQLDPDRKHTKAPES